MVEVLELVAVASCVHFFVVTVDIFQALATMTSFNAPSPEPPEPPDTGAPHEAGPQGLRFPHQLQPAVHNLLTGLNKGTHGPCSPRSSREDRIRLPTFFGLVYFSP